jgi:hypothetical protein
MKHFHFWCSCRLYNIRKKGSLLHGLKFFMRRGEKKHNKRKFENEWKIFRARAFFFKILNILIYIFISKKNKKKEILLWLLFSWILRHLNKSSRNKLTSLVFPPPPPFFILFLILSLSHTQSKQHTHKFMSPVSPLYPGGTPPRCRPFFQQTTN